MPPPHNFSSFSYMIWYKFKPLLRHKPMIFLLITFTYIMNFKCLLRLNPMIFLLFPIWFDINSNLYFGTNPWFFCSFPIYTMNFKSLLRLNRIIFLLISFSWFFFHFLYDFRYIQIFTSCQTHDFSADFLSNVYFQPVQFRAKPMIFLPISFVYYGFQIFTSAQPHHFSFFSYMIWYKFKPLLRHKPWFFCSFPLYIS